MHPGVTILGLGPGDAKYLTREAREVLEDADEIYVRTGQHPAVNDLPEELQIHSFDHLYESLEDFSEVYASIVERVLELGGRPQGVVYAVPGDPAVGEATVSALTKRADEMGIDLRVVHGVSFLEPLFAALQKDPFDGVHIVDAFLLSERGHPSFPPDTPALVTQLASKLLAAGVKLALMNDYPEDHEVALIHGAGAAQAQLESLRLFEVDQSSHIGAMSSLYVPALEQGSSLESLQNIVALLRAPDGCPWDREQTHRSLRPHLLEEAYEALDAIDKDDLGSLKEELGDLLIQIVMQAQIAAEAGDFTMAEVISGIHDKIVARHPHVFGDLEIEGVDQVLTNWEFIKSEERQSKGESGGVLDGVPSGLPALAQAAEIQARSVRVGFDWEHIEGVIEKVNEELREVQSAGSDREREQEFGDLLFALVNYARWRGLDAEAALREANSRFRQRFGVMETRASQQGIKLKDMSLAEKEAFWQEAKQIT